MDGSLDESQDEWIIAGMNQNWKKYIFINGWMDGMIDRSCHRPQNQINVCHLTGHVTVCVREQHVINHSWGHSSLTQRI